MHVAHDADDLRNDAVEHRYAETFPDRALRRPESPRERLVDDDMRRRVDRIARVERAAGNERDVQRAKQLRVHVPDIRYHRIASLRSARVTERRRRRHSAEW